MLPKMKLDNRQHNFPLNSSTGKWTLLSTILPSSMAFIDSTALNVILPSLQRDLGASGTDLFWVLNSYLLMLAALIIVGGGLGDKLGRVKIFKIGIVIFIIGSALCGFSPDIYSLIVFRTVQGIGGAFMIPGSLSIIASVFSREDKGKAIGTWSAATTIVMICGPVLGGVLADIGMWRLIFFINIPLGLVSLYTLHLKVPESYEPGARGSKIDWTGATVLVLSLASLTFGLLEMPQLGYTHWIVLTSLILGIVLMIAFPIIENRTNDPMVPLSIFKNLTFSGVNILSFFLYAGLGAVMLFFSLNIIQIQGYSQLQAGLTFLPFSVIMVSMARKMGTLTDKYGARRFLILGPAITGIGMIWLSEIGMTNGPSDYWTTYFPGFILFAFGMAITVVPLTTEVMSCVDESKSGIASGINNSVTRISGTFMNAIAGAMAIYMFTDFVVLNVDLLELSGTVKNEIVAQSDKLGDAKAPMEISASMQTAVNDIYKKGFIETYRWISRLSAALAFISAGVAFFMVKQRSHD